MNRKFKAVCIIALCFFTFPYLLLRMGDFLYRTCLSFGWSDLSSGQATIVTMLAMVIGAAFAVIFTLSDD